MVKLVAVPVAILLCATPYTSAVEQSRGGRLSLQQGAIGTRLAGRYTEGDVEMDVRAILAPLAADLRINHGEYRHRQHNRSYDLPEHHTRAVRNESGPGRNLMGEAKRR